VRTALKLGVGATLAALSAAASASCGSAFCTLMTDRYAQGAGESHLGWSADLRIESVSQTRLRSGTHDIDASQVTGEDAIERHTKNLNLVTTLGYGIDTDWSLLARIPVVRRDHLHDLIDEATGAAPIGQQWRFTRLGDVQLLARRQVATQDMGARTTPCSAGSSSPPDRRTSSTPMGFEPSGRFSPAAERPTRCSVWRAGTSSAAATR